MADISNSTPQSHSPTSGKSHSHSHSSGGRQRIIASCLTCRRRKVRCDHGHPICGACTRGNHVCTYATDQGPGQTGSNRISKSALQNGKGALRNADVQARLDRLELLLEKAVSGQALPDPQKPPKDERERQGSESQTTPSSTSQTSYGAGMSSDNNDGTLLLDEGQSQFVSSLHYALLADEVRVACMHPSTPHVLSLHAVSIRADPCRSALLVASLCFT